MVLAQGESELLIRAQATDVVQSQGLVTEHTHGVDHPRLAELYRGRLVARWGSVTQRRRLPHFVRRRAEVNVVKQDAAGRWRRDSRRCLSGSQGTAAPEAPGNHDLTYVPYAVPVGIGLVQVGYIRTVVHRISHPVLVGVRLVSSSRQAASESRQDHRH